MMVGREVILTVQKKPAKPAEEVLKVEDLHVKDIRGLESVRGVSFSVHAGEVLGIAGVQGNGQTELAEALTGLRHVESGRFILSGKDLTGKTPRLITETGLAHIPKTARSTGLCFRIPSRTTWCCAIITSRVFPKGGHPAEPGGYQRPKS
jgi:general nucleoside transport system ATP-binding protein